MKTPAVAVLDVGKTNKKVRLYDRKFQVLAEERTSIEPYFVDDLEVENTDTLIEWFCVALKKLSAHYDIRSIAVSAHGATCAVLDEHKQLVHPVLSYTASKGEEILDEFFATFGDRIRLHRETCSPDLGFANVGKHLFYLKARKPEAWKKARFALFYPGFIGFALTGKLGMETTYLGNHTYLWNFKEWKWSSVAKTLHVDHMFPAQLSSPWELLGHLRPEIASACEMNASCKVTQGIHDSNANFLPYLAQGYSNFLLNSTGTWCVLMRQADQPDLTDEEIEAKVFFNLDALGKPVRTCIFPAGMEYDTFRGFTKERDRNDTEAVRKVIAERKLFVIPGVLSGAKPFPNATPRVVNGETEYPLQTLQAQDDRPMTPLDQDYYAALNISLAFATRRMLRLCGVKEGTKVFVEGGFANNVPYCEVLATICPEIEVLLTNVKEGTSFGAALTGWMLHEGLSLSRIGKEFKIETSRVVSRDFGDIASYYDAFEKLVAR